MYNEFIETKPDNQVVIDIKKRIEELVEEETELNALRVNHLIEISDYNHEVEKVREEIKENTQELNRHLMRGVTKSDFVKINEFDETKVNKFIEEVIIDNYQVTFCFTNGISISRKYSNGPSGNQKGWKNKQQINS